MRKSGLLLIAATVLASVPLAAGVPSAGAMPPPPPCVRTVTVNDVSVHEGTPKPGGTISTPLKFTLTTTGCTARAAQVGYLVFNEYLNNNDYSAAPGVLSWPAGNGDPKAVTIRITKDAVAEHDERVYLQLCPGPDVTVPAGSGGQGTIVNDDPGDPAPEVPIGPNFVCK